MKIITALLAATTICLASTAIGHAKSPLPSSTDKLVKYGEVEGWTVYDNETRGDCLLVSSDNSGTVQMGVTTDVLNRLFSNDNKLLMMARDFGLGVVDRMPSLKDFFIGQAASTSDRTSTDTPNKLFSPSKLTGDQPRLLNGEAI